MENIEIVDEEKFKKEQKELELKEDSTEIIDQIKLTIELLKNKNQEEKNTIDDQELNDLERRSQNESNIQELIDLDSNAKNEENDLAVVEMIDEYLQSNFGEPKYDTNGDLMHDSYISTAKENVAMMKFRLTPKMQLEKDINKYGKKRIDKLVKEYKSRIESFKSNYIDHIKLKEKRIEYYVNSYSEQLKILSRIKREESAKIIEYILNEIAKFLELGRVEFNESSSRYIQNKIRWQFIQSPPIQIDKRIIKALALTFFSKAPEIKSRTERELSIEIFLDWWEIEEWKHRKAKDLINYSNKRVKRHDKLGSLIHKKRVETIKIVDKKEIVIKEMIVIEFQTKEERDEAISERIKEISIEQSDWNKTAIHTYVSEEFDVSVSTVNRVHETYK